MTNLILSIFLGVSSLVGIILYTNSSEPSLNLKSKDWTVATNNFINSQCSFEREKDGLIPNHEKYVYNDLEYKSVSDYLNERINTREALKKVLDTKNIKANLSINYWENYSSDNVNYIILVDKLRAYSVKFSKSDYHYPDFKILDIAHVEDLFDKQNLDSGEKCFSRLVNLPNQVWIWTTYDAKNGVYEVSDMSLTTL